MAMKPCKECGKEISTGASACPNCGKKNPTTSTAQKVVGFVVVAFVMLFICGKLAGTSSTSTSSASATRGGGLSAVQTVAAVRTAAVEVDARRLWQDYDSNEVAADNVYKGRILKVHGTVSSISKNFMEDIIVHLASQNQFMDTMAEMKKSEAGQAAALSKGQRVVLSCEGKGRIVGSPSLDDCTFAQ